MKKILAKSMSSANGLFNQIVAEKRKAVLALCLIALMCSMWFRVLTKNGPEAAEAAVTAGQVDAGMQLESELKVSFIKLPQVAGRNDVLTRDFFALGNWRDFIEGHGRKLIEEVNIVSEDNDQEVVRRVAENLRLEAIVSGKNPLAFINDQMLGAGDKILVSDGADKYECEVIEVSENKVIIRCMQAMITLKISRDSETADSR